ncbi:hypothetical protein LYNGBM3L_74300 [Moorena producens 3L]|uniref:Uncharacterized protein n=1 Tax=Moorena producens 3L TaxID=489825 RepID=F4XRB1_9CYAN|nr:hypothetical protein LYNGBM3L_74300 [Moorena producens 3L]
MFRFLRVIAPAPQLVDAEIGMGAIRQANRRRCAADLFDRDGMFEIAEPGAAIFFADRNAVQAKLPHFGPEVTRELIGFVHLCCNWRDLVLREPMYGVADHFSFFGKAELQSRVRHGHGGCPLWTKISSGPGIDVDFAEHNRAFR